MASKKAKLAKKEKKTLPQIPPTVKRDLGLTDQIAYYIGNELMKLLEANKWPIVPLKSSKLACTPRLTEITYTNVTELNEMVAGVVGFYRRLLIEKYVAFHNPHPFKVDGAGWCEFPVGLAVRVTERFDTATERNIVEVATFFEVSP